MYEKLYHAGLALCLTWNIIAVTAAWIKGEGQFRYEARIFLVY